MEIAVRWLIARADVRVLPYGLLLVGAYAFIWQGIGPAHLYHHQTPVFMAGGDCLAESWSTGPGGLVESCGAWLTESYQWPWWGSLVLVALLAAGAVLSDQWLAGMAGPTLAGTGWVPAVLLLVLLDGGALPVAAILAFDLALLGAVLLGAAPRKPGWGGPAAFVLLSLVLYPLVAGPYLFFVMLAAVQAAARRRFVFAGFCASVGVAVAYVVGIRLLDGNVQDAFLRNLLFDYDLNPQVVSIATYAFYPLTALWVVVVSRGRGQRSPASTSAVLLPATIRAGAVAVFAVVAVYSFRNPLSAMILRVDQHARERQWVQVLEVARPFQWSQVASVDRLERLIYLPYLSVRFPRKPQQSVPLRPSYESLLHNVNLALQQQGRLLDELFTYPQVMGMSAVRMLPDNLGPYVAHSYNMDVLLQLGYVNEAERVACEALANIGPRPWLLQRLVLIYALKDEPATARVFLESLARQPAHAAWAHRYRQALEVDPGLLRDPLAARVRPRMHRDDFVGSLVGANPDEEMLLRLLSSDPHNRVAFDFLMAHYLLNLQSDQVARRTSVIEQFGYNRVPRYMQEAVLMHAKLSGEQPDPRDGRISPATIQRFRRFDQVIEQMGGLNGSTQRQVRDALRPGFADTYWFYYLFGNTFFQAEAGTPQEGR